jgi:hypothetical protein
MEARLRYMPVYQQGVETWYIYDTLEKILLDYYKSSSYNEIIIMCDNLNQGWAYIMENKEWME